MLKLLRRCASDAGGTESIPGQGTKTSAGHEVQQKKILNKEINPDRKSKQLSLDETTDVGDRETDGRKIAKYELA